MAQKVLKLISKIRGDRSLAIWLHRLPIRPRFDRGGCRQDDPVDVWRGAQGAGLSQDLRQQDSPCSAEQSRQESTRCRMSIDGEDGGPAQPITYQWTSGASDRLKPQDCYLDLVAGKAE